MDDKLPAMPDAKHWQVLSPVNGDHSRAMASEVYTGQQMREYALAVRKAALEEVAAALTEREALAKEDVFLASHAWESGFHQGVQEAREMVQKLGGAK